MVIDGIEIDDVSLDQIKELDTIFNGSKSDTQPIVQLQTYDLCESSR